MRKFLILVKISAALAIITLAAGISSGTAFGVTAAVQDQALLNDVPGSLSRASMDIRVRRLRQMLSSHQISAEEYFARAKQSGSIQTADPEQEASE